MRILKAEVEKVFIAIVFSYELADPKTSVNDVLKCGARSLWTNVLQSKGKQVNIPVLHSKRWYFGIKRWQHVCVWRRLAKRPVEISSLFYNNNALEMSQSEMGWVCW